MFAKLTASSLAGSGAASVGLGAPLTGVGSIENTDRAILRIESINSPAPEGSAAAPNTAQFKVTLDKPVEAQTTVSWATVDFGAIAGEDYVAASGNVTITPLTLQGATNIFVTVIGDSIVELDEILQVELGGPSFDVEGISGFVDFQYVDGNPMVSGYHTIGNDDVANLNILPIGDVDEDAGTITVQVEMTGKVDYEVVVEMFTFAGTANSSDYEVRVQELRFQPSSAATQLLSYELNIYDDELVEAATENFTVVFADVNAAGRERDIGKIVPSQTVGINDNDQSLITINDVSKPEGTHPVATNPYVFTVTFSKRVDVPFTFTYWTVADTATAGADYVPVAAPVTITVPANTDSLTITIDVVMDTAIEGNETFLLWLGSLSAPGRNVVLQDSFGIGTILNED